MGLVVDMLRRSCLAFGDKPAFRVKVSGRWVDYSYRQLWTDSDRIATALARRERHEAPGSRGASLAFPLRAEHPLSRGLRRGRT